MSRKSRRTEHGFTLVELMVVVAVIGVLCTIAIPLFAGVQARGRVAKAQADSRTLASAVGIYGAHMGRIPATLNQLTTVSTNSQGLGAGPFMNSLPVPPGGWTVYSYVPNAAVGTYTISSTGDATTVTAP